MNNEKFTPVIRFAVMSDIHLKDTHEVEHDRFIKGINDAYKIAESSEEYKNLENTRVLLTDCKCSSGIDTGMPKKKKTPKLKNTPKRGKTKRR